MTIDRYQLVKRHNPVLERFDPDSPVSVGNGELAFTVDATGLQTFPTAYLDHMPLCTQAQWGWHTTPPGDGKAYTRKQIKLKKYDAYGREAGYAISAEGQEELYHWLRQNPHRLNLCGIGFEFGEASDSEVGMEALSGIRQELDLWSGIITSCFRLDGAPVRVRTGCHPAQDTLAVRIESPQVGDGSLRVKFSFPYGSPAMHASDWDSEEKHRVEWVGFTEQSADLLHVLDNDHYFIRIGFSEGAQLVRRGKNGFILCAAAGSSVLDFTCTFSLQGRPEVRHTYETVEKASVLHWEAFWREGGAVELSGSADRRAVELERRIVLSQYLTAIQCAGSLPPQETGLTCNSWYGKYHLEMHYWHAAHFPLWGRAHLLEKSLWWYASIMDKAIDLAREQGYRGVRWPKMVAYDGFDSPSPIGPLLIWQQPHPILLAELCYRAHPDQRTLALYGEIVFQTAEFMASYAFYDSRNDRYVLGPPLIPAQENHKPEITLNPAYELEYWKYGLTLANLWRARLGLNENSEWNTVASKMAKLPEQNGIYLAHENCPDTFSRFNHDHPSMLCALGVLPGSMADRGIMSNTLQKVMKEWKFEQTWGWDFPVIAMTAARLGKPEIAVDVLLMDAPKNTYRANGHNAQIPRKDLPLYLPGNGGLLTAVAMMAAGWDGGPADNAPGFPSDGQWKVVWEGLNRYI